MRGLCIGISDAPPLDYLPGATNGARAFADWASSQHIPYEILTDDETPVSFDDVRMSLLRLLEGKKRIARFIIYFAGHGLMRDAGEELWLLSRWLDEQRAIAVGALRYQLERYAIDQVTLVADACRSLANGPDNARLTADAVLGRGPFDREMPSVDILNAAATFQAAYMAPAKNADEEDRCIFSGVLVEALSGARDEAFEPTRGCITSGSLARFLKREVPLRAAEYGVELRPQVIAGFLPPDDVYLLVKPAKQPVFKPWPTALTAGTMGPSNMPKSHDRERGWSTRQRQSSLGFRYDYTESYREISTREGSPKKARELAHRVNEIQASYGREQARPTHFETGAGFSLAGAAAISVSVGRFAVARGERANTWWTLQPKGAAAPPVWIGGRLSLPLPLVIELQNGCWAGAAVLPEFIATFSVDGIGIASLILRRMYSPGSGRRAESAVAHLRAGMLATESAYDFAAKFREEKEQDPVMGVLASYLYDSQGDVDSVRKTALYLTFSGIAISYDMAVLGRLPVSRRDDGQLQAEIPATKARPPRSREEESRTWTCAATPESAGPVAGVFPWLRQGWALLDDGDVRPLVLDGLPELRGELLPSQFTTLGPAGGRQLRTLIEGI